MTQLSPNFSLAEFTRSDTATRLKLINDPLPEHLEHLKVIALLMEKVRALLGNKAISVNSGYRSPSLNKAVGGVSNSDHALGYACDFVCPSFGTPLEIAKLLDAKLTGFDQLIHEKKPNGEWWVHLSANPRMRNQRLTFNGAGYSNGIHPVP